MSGKSERLNLRVTPAQSAVLRRAAESRGESVTDFVLRHAVDAAAADLADRRVFLLDEEAWDRLQKMLDRPPGPKPRLHRLLTEPSVLEDS